MAEQKVKFNYLVGTRIEVPRGALTADEIAQTVQFFSFGTNDLTRTCLGLGRDDPGWFLRSYRARSFNSSTAASARRSPVPGSA